MSIAALIRAMADAGASPEAIALAVEAVEAAGSAVVAQREAARDRKRRQREKNATVTGQSRDADATVADNGEWVPPPALSPQTPLTHPPAPGVNTTREAKAREDAGFAKFWASYPRKTAKEDARKAFAKAWKILPPLEAEEILAGGLERAKADWVEAQFIPYAATWLNGKRWQDEAEVIQLNPRKAHERPHPNQPTARQDRLGRSLAGLMAAVDEREPDVGGRHS